MITTRQARKALKHTNQLIGPLHRVKGGWAFCEWFYGTAQAWVQVRPAVSYRAAQTHRRNCRLVQAATDCGIDTAALTVIVFEQGGKGRAESILSRASRKAWAEPVRKAA